MAKSFPTEFSVWVTRLETDPAGREYTGCSCGTVAPTLTLALALAYRWATFYAGPRGARVSIQEQCAACQGSGQVSSVRGRKMRRCPECRGREPGPALTFVACPHDDCAIFRCGEPIFGSLERAAHAAE